MNSLIGYGSDDHSEDSGDERFPEMPGKSVNSKTYSRAAPHEDNYEEVGMDMSEDSNDSSNRELSESSKSSRPDKSNHTSNSNQRTDRRSSSRSPKQYRGEDRRTQREDRHKIDDRHRRRDARGSRESRDVERNRRDDDKSRDRHERRDRRDERHSRDRRERRRSRSKDRRRSRSPRKSRSPKDSRSRDRGSRGFASRKEKADKRMNRLDRLGIEFKPDSYPASALEDAELQSTQGDRFFIPGITGRFRDQIEKRKLLWQKAKEPEESAVKPNTAPVSLSTAAGSKSSKVYEATTFADDKTSNKFKRLMGIKETDTANLPVKGTDVLKKQQEMFSSMEAQYEVARTATHTMRGVGLGFGSLQR